jgi:hypothetical protein
MILQNKFNCQINQAIHNTESLYVLRAKLNLFYFLLV